MSGNSSPRQAPGNGFHDSHVVRSRPAGAVGTVTIPVRHWPAGADRPTVLLIAGGPGESGLHEATYGTHRTLVQHLRSRANVVAFDQRGTGSAQPLLRAPASWRLPVSQSLSREEALGRARDLARATAALAGEDGVDPNWFNISESVEDIEAVISSLHLDRVALFGQSYGSQLGLSFLREYPHRVARAVFMNVEGPDQTVKLPLRVDGAMRELLQHEPPLSRQEPFALVRDLIERTREAPPIVARVGGQRVEIGLFELQRIIARAIGQQKPLRRLLHAIADANQSADFSALASVVREWKTSPFGALQLVVDSASGAPPERRAEIERQRDLALLGDAVDFPLPNVAEAFGVAELSSVDEDPRRTFDTPVLFVSGGRDVRTPPQNVEDLLRGFSDAGHLVHPVGMHAVGDYLGVPHLLRTVCDSLIGTEPA